MVHQRRIVRYERHTRIHCTECNEQTNALAGCTFRFFGNTTAQLQTYNNLLPFQVQRILLRGDVRVPDGGDAGVLLQDGLPPVVLAHRRGGHAGAVQQLQEEEEGIAILLCFW